MKEQAVVGVRQRGRVRQRGDCAEGKTRQRGDEAEGDKPVRETGNG